MTQERTPELAARTSLIKGFVFGTLAGLAMVLFTVTMRLVWDALSITELAADWFTERLSGETIDFLLTNLSFSAKPLMFVGLFAGQVQLSYLEVSVGHVQNGRLHLCSPGVVSMMAPAGMARLSSIRIRSAGIVA